MQKIVPFLWFDNNAEEAVNFYTSIFDDSKTGRTARYDEAGAQASGMAENSVMTIDFQIEGKNFTAINGGPHFKINPSISFFVVYENEDQVDKLWKELIDGGMVMMELQKYDWSEKYGWVQDRFGVSWQVSLGKKKEVGGNTISNCLLFVSDKSAIAKEAVNFYASVFKESEIAGIMENPDGTVMHAQFYLFGETFMAMDGGPEHKFNFNEAVSFVVNCDTQEELDYYWEKLSEGGDAKAQMCGWLKDKFGVSWQIVPSVLPELLQDSERSKRVMSEVLKMKKIDIQTLIDV